MSVFAPKLRPVILSIIAIWAVLSAQVANSQEKGSLKFAVVNPGRLLQEYKYTVESDKELQKQKNDIIAELNSWDQHRYLGEADQNTLGAIAVKENDKVELTAADKAAKTRLEDASKKLFDEYLALQTRQNPTQADSDRLKELSRLEQDTGKRIKDRQARAQDELTKKAADIRQKIDKDVRKGIEDVAKEKHFTMVFSSEVLLYCDTDITEDVLKKINK
jgi:Skp family chaperone for outer membrane proteins